MTEHFWTTDRIERLRTNMGELKSEWGHSDEVLVKLVDRHVSTEKHGILNHRTLGRFLRNQTKKPSTENLDLMLAGMTGHVIQSEANTRLERIELALLFLYQDYSVSRNGMRDPDTDIAIGVRGGDTADAGVGEDIPDTTKRGPAIRHRSLVERRGELAQFLNYLDLDEDASANISRRFFRGDDRKCYFETYRFSATKAKISKSFTVLHRLHPDLPMVRFANFLEDRGHLRIARGICLRLHDEVAFVGNLESGSSMKVMTFENANSPIDLYRGLLLTSDAQYGSLAAKFIMKRTNISNHKEAGTGELTMPEALGEITQEEVDMLRNEINFSLERPLTDNSGEDVKQEIMVAAVARLMTDGDGWLFKDHNGKPFNPASDEHYTFNSALLRRKT